MAADVRDTATDGADDPSAGRSGEPSAPEIVATARPRTVITMRDIAAVAGVSQSTVSRVLNNAPTQVPIAAETRERVLRAARDVGYRPNPHARGLRGAPTFLLGVVVRDFSDLFFAAAIEALAVEAMRRGYNVVLGHAQGREEEGLPLSAILEIRQCDAVVLLGDMQDHPRLLADLRVSPVPVVATWQGTSPREFPTADVDEESGVRAGLEHLVGLGHERIGFLSIILPGNNWQRQDAYEAFMTERFGAVRPGYVQVTPNTLAGGEEATRALLALDEPPTAIVTATDLVAVGLLHAAYDLGRTVPDDLSVVGFDDIVLAGHTVPALTTVRMPIVEIVRESVKLAIELARDPTASRAPTRRVFEPSLIVRQSTAPPGRQDRSSA